jgi:hypothetical protein
MQGALWRGLLLGLLALAGGIWLAANADGTPRAAAAESTAPGQYKCYGVANETLSRRVLLHDRFERRRMRLSTLTRLCNPAQMNDAGAAEPRAHLACYSGKQTSSQSQRIRIRHQFGTQLLTLGRATHLCAASLKEIGTIAPQGPNAATLVDHVKCYSARASAGFSPFAVNLTDQFGSVRSRVLRTESYCGPVQIDRERPRQDATGLVCFRISVELAAQPVTVTLRNRFGTPSFAPRRAEALCLPSSGVVLTSPGSDPRCAPRSLRHGGEVIFGVTGTVISSRLLVPAVTPERRLVRIAMREHAWDYKSRKEDGPERIVRDVVRVAVLWRTSRGPQSDIVECVITVKHRDKNDPPKPPRPVWCYIIPRFKIDLEQVPKTGFANFGASVSFSNIATISRWWLRQTWTWERPRPDVFAPSHGWDELVNDPIPGPNNRYERDFFVNTYWVNGDAQPPPIGTPIFVYVIEYRQRAGTKCSARVEFVFLRP